MKYIILVDENGKEYPIIFPEIFVHKFVSNLMTQLLEQTIGYVSLPVAAGSLKIKDVECWGHSESLGMLFSRPCDELVVRSGE